MPGSTGGTLLPALEAHSGKKCGPDYGLCYNPEFIALGSVIHDMLYPDMILIGEQSLAWIDARKIFTGNLEVGNAGSVRRNRLVLRDRQ